MPHVLAIDLGTTGLKVAVVRDDGAVLGIASRVITTHFVDGGGVEQDAHEWWQLIVEAIREVLELTNESANVGTVVCTSQYMSVVPIAADGVPVGPVIMWMDGRAAERTRHLRHRENIMVWLERHGLAPFGSDDLAHIVLLRHEYPQAYASAAAFVEPVDAITARLVGVVTANQNTAFPLLLVDNRVHGAVHYDTDLIARAGVDPHKLPPLVPMGAAVGVVRRSVADELGLRPDVVVLSGSIDSTTSAVGTGATTPERGGVVIGTTAVAVSHVTSSRADHMRALMTAPSPLDSQYVVLAENGAGGKTLEYVGALLGLSAADLLDAASQAPPGSEGTMFLPWLVGAMAPAPDPGARAGFVGLSLGTTSAHMARAVLEGVALNMAALLPAVEHFVGSRFDEVTFGGGAAASALWAQIIADVCGRVIYRVHEPRATNARGAALLALHQLGRVSADDLPSLVPIESIHEPDAARSAFYGEQLERLVAARELGAIRLRR
ncbi:MAG: FGGY family carbohydrate kinase [Actinomycetota bacterium]